MSFISILKKIGGIAANVEHVVAPVLTIVAPQLAGPIHVVDDMFQKLQTSITTIEATTLKDGSGAMKADSVATDFEAGLSELQSILAITNHRLVYDTAALQTAITAQVAAYNAMAAVKASFKLESTLASGTATPKT